MVGCCQNWNHPESRTDISRANLQLAVEVDVGDLGVLVLRSRSDHDKVEGPRASKMCLAIMHTAVK